MSIDQQRRFGDQKEGSETPSRIEVLAHDVEALRAIAEARSKIKGQVVDPMDCVTRNDDLDPKNDSHRALEAKLHEAETLKIFTNLLLAYVERFSMKFPAGFDCARLVERLKLDPLKLWSVYQALKMGWAPEAVISHDVATDTSTVYFSGSLAGNANPLSNYKGTTSATYGDAMTLISAAGLNPIQVSDFTSIRSQACPLGWYETPEELVKNGRGVAYEFIATTVMDMVLRRVDSTLPIQAKLDI